MFSKPSFRRWHLGKPISVSDHNRLQETVEQFSNFRSTDLQVDGAGVRFKEEVTSPLFAEILAKNDGPPVSFSWREVYKDTGGEDKTNTWYLEGDATNYPAFEINGNEDIPVGTIVHLVQGSGPFFIFSYQSASESTPLVWYSHYLHVENVLVQPGQIVSPGVQIASVAAMVNLDDYGGDAHLHWGLGDGVVDHYPDALGTQNSNVGQTIELAPFFEEEYSIPIGSAHSPSVNPPGDHHFTDPQIAMIKERIKPPVVTGAGWQSFRNSSAHSGKEYYSIDFATELATGSLSDPDAGGAVYNCIDNSVTDVVTTCMHIQNIDADIDPAGHKLGWQIILRHEYLPQARPDDVPLVAIWSKPDTGFPTFRGYVSTFQFNSGFPLSRVGSAALVGLPTAGTFTSFVFPTSIHLSPVTGQAYFLAGLLYVYDGSSWVTINNAGSSGITVAALDGNPSYPDTTTLYFDQLDGFDLSQSVSGYTEVHILPASATQTGVVTTTDQVFAGIKRFTSGTVKISDDTSANTLHSLFIGPKGSDYAATVAGVGTSGGSTDWGQLILSASRLNGSSNTKLVVEPQNDRVILGTDSSGNQQKFSVEVGSTNTYNDGVTNTYASPSSITVTGGIVTAVTASGGATGTTWSNDNITGGYLTTIGSGPTVIDGGSF